MKLLDRVLDRVAGRSTREIVAREVRRRLSAKGLGEFDFDPERNEVRQRAEDPMVFFLGNVSAEYGRAPKQARAGVLDRFVDGVTVTLTEKIPKTYAAARPSLRPVLRHEHEWGVARLHELVGQLGRPTSPSRPALEEPVERPFAGDLVVGLAYDWPNSSARIQASMLETWGVDFDTALADAIDNLRQGTADAGLARLQDEHGCGYWLSDWNDSYEASRLLMPDFFHRLGIVDPVAVVPVRNKLLVASARDAKSLELMAHVARDMIQTLPRWLSVTLLRLSDDGWKPYQASSSLQTVMASTDAIVWSNLYNEQKTCLEKLNEAAGRDVFVASSMLVEDPNGRLITVATWTEGVATLLPETNEVVPIRRDRGNETIVVGWQTVLEHPSTLMVREAQGQAPEPVRYLVTTFPDDMLWQTLRTLARPRPLNRSTTAKETRA